MMTAGLAIPAAAATPATAATTAPQSRGIDVSQYTDVTSWANVKAAGITFAGVEAAQGATVTNSNYQSEVSGAESAGLYVMPYVFADPAPNKVADGGTQFTIAWNNVINPANTSTPYRRGGLMLPIALDLEWDKINFKTEECYGLSPSAMVTWIGQFVAAEKAQIGVAPVIYTNQSWWDDCTGDSTAFNTEPLWIASYGTTPQMPAAWSSYMFWQSSGSGSVSGVNGAVDLDQMNREPISIKTANRSETAGTPIVLGTSASGPDQAAGLVGDSLKETGLPPGLTMSSSGLITGWPYVPGTYTVTITASDGLGGAGSASFTWQVGAAGNSGTAGTIRQVGGSGKCLNDPGSATANGTKPNMWTCDGKSYQNWTIVQDGTIRVAGKCLDMAGAGSAVDTPVQLWTCNSGDGAQQWQAGSYGELVNPRSGKCLYVPVTSATNGTKPTVHACSNDARHHWLRPAAPVVSGEPGKCLAVSGAAVELVTCANAASQHWVAESNGTFELSGKCLTENGTTAGSQLSLASCSGASSQKWTVASAGRIATEFKSAASGQCVSVPSTSTASGTKLVMESCAANPAGTWHVE
jgi:GH25 family lysozyme M1 (1,4-beta-N-acetylmuramidase)